MEEQLYENELYLILFFKVLFCIINLLLVLTIIKNKQKDWDFVYWVFIYWVIFLEFEYFVNFE
jgi:hypothetical protein